MPPQKARNQSESQGALTRPTTEQWHGIGRVVLTAPHATALTLLLTGRAAGLHAHQAALEVQVVQGGDGVARAVLVAVHDVAEAAIVGQGDLGDGASLGGEGAQLVGGHADGEVAEVDGVGVASGEAARSDRWRRGKEDKGGGIYAHQEGRGSTIQLVAAETIGGAREASQ